MRDSLKLKKITEDLTDATDDLTDAIEDNTDSVEDQVEEIQFGAVEFDKYTNQSNLLYLL